MLSDPNERSWYDEHREAILRGKSGVVGAGEDEEDPVSHLWAFFSTSAYAGYGDDEEGFYTVYGQVFDKINQEEKTQAEDAAAFRAAPPFGASNAEWKDVKSWYSHWEGFSTGCSCATADKYDTRTAPNRQVRRAMEKENNKARVEARRKVNECVRNLVAFVKKRDRRVHAHQLEQEAEKKAKLAKAKAARSARAAEMEAERRRQVALLQEERDSEEEAAEVARLDALMGAYDDDGYEGAGHSSRKGKRGAKGTRAGGGAEDWEKDGHAEDGVEAEVCEEATAGAAGAEEAGDGFEEDPLFCVACNKRFKNVGQFRCGDAHSPTAHAATGCTSATRISAARRLVNRDYHRLVAGIMSSRVSTRRRCASYASSSRRRMPPSLQRWRRRRRRCGRWRRKRWRRRWRPDM